MSQPPVKTLFRSKFGLNLSSDAPPLPRFVRVTFVTEVGNKQGSYAAAFGGLLQKASVYLAYDPSSSTAYEAIWRDINLPESLGKWTLRAWEHRDRIAAELAYFQLTENTVLPPVMFRISEWNPSGQNLLQADCTTCRTAVLKDALLQLEPA